MIQLRLRTEYTFGGTYAPIGRVIERLKAIGCTAAGIVDVDSTWGHVPWFKACKEAGIKPLLGIDIMVTDNPENVPRMWFLASTTDALSELYEIISQAHHQPVKTPSGDKPRLYPSDVLAMSDKIIKFAGDKVDPDFLSRCRNIYLDINPASRMLNNAKFQLAEKTGLELVSTSDNAYCYEDDRPIFELVDWRRGVNQTAQHILDRLDHQDVAAEIAEQCKDLALPKAPMIRVKGNLEKVCRKGIKKRKLKWTPEYEERLQYELGLIREKDFESYFIVVSDMVQYAKKHMLVGPSRGSAAGSLVCYTSAITEIDPLPPQLYFERFIDINRTDLPDIDLDFPDDKRIMVFEYMAKKYGAANVAHIGTISQYKPKSALIQVCKRLGIPPAATAAIKTAIIERSIADSRAKLCLQDTFETTQIGKTFIKQYPQAEIAARIEGHASHTGIHAAGLLVCTEPITRYAVVDANGIAHTDKYSAEYVGLLKIDILGLRTLGVIADADVGVDWYNLPLDDPKALDVFNQGRLCSIFQFDGPALQSYSKAIHFRGIREIDAATALARPGPFGSGVSHKYLQRHNGESYDPIHPKIQELMSDTYGLPLYQEQTLAIVRNIGKFGWDETSFVRRAISKRMGKEFFQKFYPKFLEGAMSQGIGEKAAREIWELINAMGAWQMNKAHTYSYAVISYWTAYLKAHFPLEFAAANLRNAKDEDNATDLLREMVREGIEYVPFDIEHSKLNWSVQNGRLIGGFLALKGIGDAKAAKLIEARDAGCLTPKQLEEIQKAENVFGDIFPFETRYGPMYREPRKHNIAADTVTYIRDLVEGMPHRDERVFFGELIHKSGHSANDEVDVKKRDGKLAKGPLDYVNVKLKDDTGIIGGRVGRYDYKRIGRELLEEVPLGAHLAIRARFYNGIRYAFIMKWRRIDNAETGGHRPTGDGSNGSDSN